MKMLLLMLVVVPGLAAQVFKPIDITKQADVNGKKVDMPVLQFPTLTQPTYPVTQSALSDKMREPGQVLPRKLAETKGVLDFPTVTPGATLPGKAFPTTTADVAGKLPPATSVPTQGADIPTLKISPFTPAGEEQLKDQFRTPR
jgi:hypothetical protein